MHSELYFVHNVQVLHFLTMAYGSFDLPTAFRYLLTQSYASFGPPISVYTGRRTYEVKWPRMTVFNDALLPKGSTIGRSSRGRRRRRPVRLLLHDRGSTPSLRSRGREGM